MQRSGFHASSGLKAEQMTRVVSYVMIGRINRTVSTIIKYVLLISEIGSCVIYILFGCMYFVSDICHSFAFVLQR